MPGSRSVIALVMSCAVTGETYADLSSSGLYGIDLGFAQELIKIDTDTAVASVIGQCAFSPLTGLAYDPQDQTLFAVNPGTRSLYRVAFSTGATTLVGSFGGNYFNVNGLAFDSIDRVLYATDNATNSLLRLDPATGAVTMAAPIRGGFRAIEGLGYDRVTRTLYGISEASRRLVSIDTTSGITTGIGPVLPGGLVWRGLEFDPERRVLYATTTNQLFRFDPLTGTPTLIGTMNASVVQGLAFVPGAGSVVVFGMYAPLLLRRTRKPVRASSGG